MRGADGEAVPGVFVSATAASGRLTHTVLSDAAGRYSLDGVTPGNYTITAAGPSHSSGPAVDVRFEGPATPLPELSGPGHKYTGIRKPLHPAWLRCSSSK